MNMSEGQPEFFSYQSSQVICMDSIMNCRCKGEMVRDVQRETLDCNLKDRSARGPLALRIGGSRNHKGISLSVIAPVGRE